jgi:hypothetical protein
VRIVNIHVSEVTTADSGLDVAFERNLSSSGGGGPLVAVRVRLELLGPCGSIGVLDGWWGVRGRKL